MKIGFATDTNIVKKNRNDLCDEIKIFDTMDIFTEYIDSLNKSVKSEKKLIYFLPITVIDELCSQKILAFNESYKKLVDKYNTLDYGLKGNLPKNNIDKLVSNERNQIIDKVKVLDIKYSKKLFNEIVTDAIKKDPPFEKTEGGKKADAGFKDALIWKTILYSKEIDECDKFYFCSGDKIFIDNKDEFEKQFKKNHKDTIFKLIYVKPGNSMRQDCLQQIIFDNDLCQTDVIKLYDEDLLIQSIIGLRYLNDDSVYYYSNDEKMILDHILFEQFSKDDFFVKNVEKNENNYIVYIEFETSKYKNKNNEDLPDRNIYGSIKLTYERKSNNQFGLIDSSISRVRFNRFNHSLSNTLINLYTNGYKELVDNILEIAKNNTMPASSSLYDALKNATEQKNKMISAFTSALNNSINEELEKQ